MDDKSTSHCFVDSYRRVWHHQLFECDVVMTIRSTHTRSVDNCRLLMSIMVAVLVVLVDVVLMAAAAVALAMMVIVRLMMALARPNSPLIRFHLLSSIVVLCCNR